MLKLFEAVLRMQHALADGVSRCSRRPFSHRRQAGPREQHDYEESDLVQKARSQHVPHISQLSSGFGADYVSSEAVDEPLQSVNKL